MADLNLKAGTNMSIRQEDTDLYLDNTYEYDDTEIQQDLLTRSLITETGNKIELTLNNTNYKMTAILKDKYNNVISTSSEIDLPIESLVVSIYYDSTTKELVFVLKDGTTTRVPLLDLIDGLATEEDLQTFEDDINEDMETFKGDVEQELEKAQQELDKYKMLENALPKVTGTGEYINLDKTAKCHMKVGFKGQIQQASTSISGGDEYDSPSPDHPQDIHIVSGDNTIKVCNKNLCPNSVATSTASGNMDYSNTGTFGKVEKGETYTLSLTIASDNTSTGNTEVRCYTSTSGGTNQGKVTQFNRLNGGGQITKTFTSDYTGYLSFSGSGMLNSSNVFTNIQLELGSTATTYVRHQEYTKEISLGSLEICKIGTYEDEFFKNTIDSEYYDSNLELNKWYLKKRIGKVVLDGTETGWNFASTDTNTSRFYIAISNKIDGTTENASPLLLSNYFTPETFHDMYYNDVEAIASYGGSTDSSRKRVYLRISNSLATTTDALKTWLSTHNTTVYYVLATPTNTLLNDTLQETLDSFYSWQEQTNIMQDNNDIPFVIKASAIYDLTDLVNRVATLETE